MLVEGVALAIRRVGARTYGQPVDPLPYDFLFGFEE